jgi:hypothetical protein
MDLSRTISRHISLPQTMRAEMGTKFMRKSIRGFCVSFIIAAFSLYGCNDVSKAPTPPPPLSPDALLTSLTVSPGTLQPAFSSDTINYSVDVAFTVTSVTVTAKPQSTTATVSIAGSKATTGQVNQSITLGGPGSSIPIFIVVTAQSGAQNTYAVTVNRGVNNNLQNLTVSPGALAPTFNANTTSYTVDVASNVSSVNVTATLQDPTTSMTIIGLPTGSGQLQGVTLNPAGTSTPVSIIVTAQNGSQKAYLVTVNRAALGGNNNLQSLTVSSGSLSPAFNANTTSYTVDVASNVNSVNVTATLQDANASMTINGQGTSSGQMRSITLNGPGLSTVVTIVVTAPNGTQKTYFVTVNRAALGGNNNLQSLTVSSGSLSPAFNANTTNYSVDVASTVGSLTVTAQAQDSGATVSINGQAGTSRSIALNAAGQSTLISIVVTAPNLNEKTYTVFVNRAALGVNNNLSALTLSAGPLQPSFNALITSYDVGPVTATDTTITATAADSNATLTINGSATTSGEESAAIALVPGANPISIVVTAQNGSSTKTYTVTITVN